MTREEIQIQQIEENIASLERRIETIRRGPKSANTPDLILKYESVIADLKGCKKWHQGRLERE